jgi:hypothetical protein
MKPLQNKYEVCERAATALVTAGFILDYVSQKSEARYYRWPDRDDLLRLAAHRKKTEPPGMKRIASKLTFNGSIHILPDEIRIADEKIEGAVAQAIGRYFLNSDAQS